jgi:hypothetical protein
LGAAVVPTQLSVASAASPARLTLNVLLIGNGTSDPTTAAWQAALTSEGVAYTLATATGGYGAETVTLPALTNAGGGNFNGVVFAGSPLAFAAGQLTALDAYESTYAVRQIDGYAYPSPWLGQTEDSAGPLDGTTATLSAAGLAGLPGLKGPLPIEAGSYGYPATPVVGAPFTPWIENTAGQVLGGVYQHPSTDPQAGVSELSLNFDYNASMLQWLLLAPGLINWVTQGTHLGLYRNYFGQDVDDTFIADNSWSSQYQCTPGATEPSDYTCPAGVANNPADTPPDVQMSAADVAYVVAWEQANNITLNLAFNGVGACTAPSTGAASSANCNGAITDSGTTYTDPGQLADSSAPNDQGLINALLADKADFNWTTHTWSHEFLGCVVWQPQAVTSVVPNATGGSFTAGSYNYEVTAATAYGESEPSTPSAVTVGASGSVTLTWPDATNGTGTGGTPGPTLSQEEAVHTGGSGFWGYYVYRENPGATSYGLVGQVPEDSTGAATTYSFTDLGATAPGAAPGSSDSFPTATNPGIDCSSAANSWDPAADPTGSTDASIQTEIAWDQAFAAANALPNYSPSVAITGEHSGVENPNMPGALAATGVTTFATDASRQPTQYSLTSGAATALSAPRYPSNIYYNASNWTDELNEYNTLYVAPGVSIGNSTYPTETGHCGASSSTTCLSTPATQATLLASESRIMLSHVLANDPRVGYAHQTNLIGASNPSNGYVLLTLLSNMLAQYNAWTTTPLQQVTDATDAQTLALQSAWAKVLAPTQPSVTATEQNGVVTVTNTGASALNVPITVPLGTTVSGTPFGQSYGGESSAWTNLAAAGTITLAGSVAPTILSANFASSIVGAPFSDTVTTTGSPTATITEVGALPTGITFTDNTNGTATLAGTAAAGTGGSYPITISATNTAGTATQVFTLTNAEAPTITSATTASFSTGVAGTYTVTTTGYPAATITEVGALPAGLTFVDKGNGTATISGTAASGSAGSYPVSIKATNVSGSTATLGLAITVKASAAPVITSGATAYFTLNHGGAFAVSTSGSPIAAITEVGSLPAGLTFVDGGNGTALVSGTPTATGTTTLNVTAANGIAPNATQTLVIIVGQAPTITSAASATASVGAAFSFAVTTTGYPAASLGESGALPSGLVFALGTNGTATISGTPAAASGGRYPITISVVNGTGTTTQAFTLTVGQAPSITSATSATANVGAAFSFTVTTTGYPAPALTESGALPSGLVFTAGTNGTATISGTPATTSAGSYPITISVQNASGTATQTFTLTVGQGPSITSAASASATVGTAFSFTVSASGNPAPTLSEAGALPSGVTFTGNANGSATIAGTPTAGGAFTLTISAKNTTGTATQAFTLTVNQTPSITSASSASATVGTAFSFTLRATGYPTPALTETGVLPSGVTFTGSANGSATIAGTPTAGGVFTLTISAKNTTGTATQAFTLTVNQTPRITSAASASASRGRAFTFAVTATGYPTPTLSETGALPSGVTFTSNGAGKATLSGTPRSTGTFRFSITAKNSTATVTQTFTLSVR